MFFSSSRLYASLLLVENKGLEFEANNVHVHCSEYPLSN